MKIINLWLQKQWILNPRKLSSKLKIQENKFEKTIEIHDVARFYSKELGWNVHPKR